MGDPVWMPQSCTPSTGERPLRVTEWDAPFAGRLTSLSRPAPLQRRPDLAAVPLEGVEPGHVVLGTRAGDRGRLITAFRQAARNHLTGPACPLPG